ELPLPLVADEDPRRVQVHPAQDLFQGDVQDLRDLLRPVDPRGHLRQDHELPLALAGLTGQGPHAILVRLPEALAAPRCFILPPNGKIFASSTRTTIHLESGSYGCDLAKGGQEPAIRALVGGPLRRNCVPQAWQSPGKHASGAIRGWHGPCCWDETVTDQTA